MLRRDRSIALHRRLGSRASPAALVLLGAVACFTGDELTGKPCEAHADCNPRVDPLGDPLYCVQGVCLESEGCGDRVVDEMRGEDCDEGEDNLVEADYSAEKGACKAFACTLLPYCGDGVVQQAHEQCDDGEGNGEGRACKLDCTLNSCGDGYHGPDEDCDDGDMNSEKAYAQGPNVCSRGCKFVPHCGDGEHQEEHEQCDDGDDDPHDECLPECKDARCGDGVLRKGHELCDDGNKNDTDECHNDCKPTSCGNGLLEPPEQCDDGNTIASDDCLDTCMSARCGDGFVEVGVEECDPGAPNSGMCTLDCKVSKCGDGILDHDEQCDDGNDEKQTDSCVGDCEVAQCGDGFVWDGHEQCDDGGHTNGDGCSADCRVELEVFVTSEASTGKLGGITGADGRCEKRAKAAGLKGEFRAWLSDDSQAPNGWMDANFAGVYRLVNGGAVIAEGWAGLTTKDLLHAIDTTEHGDTLVDGERVWTSTSRVGVTLSEPDPCADWTGEDAAKKAYTGRVEAQDGHWTVDAKRMCSEQHHLICFEVGSGLKP